MTEAEYGLWPSPITAEIVSQGAKSFGTVEVKEGQIYWEEIRPLEGGRTVITSTSKDFTPPSYNARSMVHEYGGKSFTTHESTIYFVNKKDQRIYQQIGDLITPITKEGPRFADLCFTPQGLIAIGEIHHDEGLDVDNFLALIDLPSGTIDRLAEGEDFYSSPALHPNGKTLAWISWNLPYLPWDGCDLFVGELTDKSLTHIKKIAGSISESISQPKWGPDGLLYFISDKSGWWNIYRLKDHQIESLCPMEAEFGMPQWSFGISTYDFVDNEIICTYFQNGIASLAIINPNTKRMKKLPCDATFYGQIRAKGNGVVYIKGMKTAPLALFELNLKTLEEKPLSIPQAPPIDSSYYSNAQPISFPSAKGRIAHGFYYPPKNPHCKGPKGSLPPLIVKIHGGPTHHVTGTFSLATQYWTSRGFALIVLNYGGSSGYGRGYRDLLNGNWGKVDVEDSEAAADYFVSRGLADPHKLVITGGSAGGYTTLRALTVSDMFQGGASYYGISDLELLTKSHKFESGYCHQLIGPYPESKELYKERSPLYHVDQVHKSILFLQGSEDAVVPPEQAILFFEALKKKGIYTKLIIYQGEGHGFRKAENIVHSLQEELKFYLQIFYHKELSPPPIEKIIIS